MQLKEVQRHKETKVDLFYVNLLIQTIIIINCMMFASRESSKCSFMPIV